MVLLVSFSYIHLEKNKKIFLNHFQVTTLIYLKHIHVKSLNCVSAGRHIFLLYVYFLIETLISQRIRNQSLYYFNEEMRKKICNFHFSNCKLLKLFINYQSLYTKQLLVSNDQHKEDGFSHTLLPHTNQSNETIPKQLKMKRLKFQCFLLVSWILQLGLYSKYLLDKQVMLINIS